MLPMNLTSLTSVREAIELSISQNRTVAICCEADYDATDYASESFVLFGGEADSAGDEVWGTTESGEEWRLEVVHPEDEDEEWEEHIPSHYDACGGEE